MSQRDGGEAGREAAAAAAAAAGPVPAGRRPPPPRGGPWAPERERVTAEVEAAVPGLLGEAAGGWQLLTVPPGSFRGKRVCFGQDYPRLPRLPSAALTEKPGWWGTAASGSA